MTSSGEGESGSIHERLDSVLQPARLARTPGKMHPVLAALRVLMIEETALSSDAASLFGGSSGGGCSADHRLIRDICRKRHIDRPAVVQRLRDQSLCFVSRVLGCHDGAGTNDFFSHLVEEVEFTVSQRCWWTSACAAWAGRFGIPTRWKTGTCSA